MDQSTRHIDNAEFRTVFTSDDGRLLARLVDRLFPGVTKYLKERHATPHEAEEIFYTAITVLWEKGRWNGFDAKFNFYPYLLEICKHQLYNIFRDKKKRDNWVTPEDVVLLNPDPDIQGLLELVEWRSKLYQCLGHLGDRCQELLLYWAEEGLTFEEIAQKMNYKNAETARQKKHKCMGRLRDIFGEGLNH